MRKRKQRDKYPVKGRIIQLNRLGRKLGVSAKTLRRWRKKGWLETLPRGKRLMVTDEMVRNFLLLMQEKGYLQARIIEKNPRNR
jgi:predicted site-specific integrase-resolvase